MENMIVPKNILDPKPRACAFIWPLLLWWENFFFTVAFICEFFSIITFAALSVVVCLGQAF